MIFGIIRHKRATQWLSTCLCLFSFNVLAQYVVTDSFGKHTFDTPPSRIVVTDWTLLEQLLELGILPVGAPELAFYKKFVAQPSLPADITDIGLRRSPNSEAIRALNPDVIIIGTDQKKLARPLSRFSRVMFYKSFSDKYRTNGIKSETRFLQIAELFQKRQFAEQKLGQRNIELERIKTQIYQHFNENVPPLTVIRFSTHSNALVYGDNSILAHTMALLGIPQGISTKRTKWGEQEMSITKLSDVKGSILYVEPVESQQILQSQAWRNLPLVKQQRVGPMAATWSYGGAMSVLYNARAIRDGLMAISNK